ncbi:hypothetical protein [Microbacterium candidum]|uniref:Uncharacterized protein n=1 Tax=Microbacterium candidum TaxID=3041922 RepID=A0ABT7MW16_9MICO|nr:hypothetical protein [Microbacterium sp. ASV49]MDL9978653.1 hypothetical protein [Microbacterium sp. ASV49]
MTSAAGRELHKVAAKGDAVVRNQRPADAENLAGEVKSAAGIATESTSLTPTRLAEERFLRCAHAAGSFECLSGLVRVAVADQARGATTVVLVTADGVGAVATAVPAVLDGREGNHCVRLLVHLDLLIWVA